MPIRPKLITLLIAVLGALAWALSAAPAEAGGPTSLLLVDRVNGKAAGLYYSDAAYDQLGRALDYQPADTSTTRPASVSDDYSNRIMLTWLVHDVSIWRIDQVFITDGDGIWVSTQVDFAGGNNPINQPAAWHRPAVEKALLLALTSTGMLPRESPASARGTVPPPTFPASKPQSSASATAAPAATSTSGSGGPSGLLTAGAGLIGLVVGAGGMLLYRRSRSARPHEPDRFVLSG